MIYFADARDGRIKIGVTHGDVAKRVRAVGSHLNGPLEIVGSIEGDRSLERAIHEHLSEYRLRGEWFRDCAEVRRAIRNLILGGGRAIGFEESRAVLMNESSQPVPSKFDPELFARTTDFIWGENANAELAELASVEPSVAATWIDGTVKPPRIVRLAMGGLFMQTLSQRYQ